MDDRRLDLALASCAELPEPDPDAEPLAVALRAAGLNFAVVAWDDPPIAAGPAPRLTILRSTWNYPQRPDAFLSWAQSTASRGQLWNPLPVVRWNLHKSYLLRLASLDIPVVPTAVAIQGSDAGALAAIVASRHWDQVVLKPAVSAASHNTVLVDGASAAADTLFREMVLRGDLLVQPYVRSVEDYGERAVIWIDGELTHAVRKQRRFEGEHEFVSAASISNAEAELARHVIETVQRSLATPLLYARVDVAPDTSGAPLVMELELIEPSLYFAQGPRALARFVSGIKSRLADLESSRPSADA